MVLKGHNSEILHASEEKCNDILHGGETSGNIRQKHFLNHHQLNC